MSATALSFHAFLATTLDGFIARPDGTIDFLDEANKKIPPGEDCGIAAFMSSVDAIVMGRTTYIQVLGFKNQGLGWQYGDTPLFVLSRSLEKLPDGSPESVKLLSLGKGEDRGGIDEAVRRVQEEVEKRGERGQILRVYVDGGEVVRTFIQAKMLDEITLTTVPVLIGEGKSLFGAAGDVKMELLNCKSWEFGFVQLRYRFKY